MLEEGYYPGRAVEWGLGESGNGNPQVAVLFDVFSDDGTKLGQRTWYGTFGDRALEFTVKGLRACGWEGTDLSDLSGLDRDEVQLVIQHETYNGKTRDKIAFVNRKGGLALKTPMQSGTLRSFAAQMRSKIQSIDIAEGRMPTPPKTTSEEEKEDIPF